MKFALNALALCTTFLIQPAQADLNNDCEFILDSAQQLYPDWFPTNEQSQFLGPWCFRYYDNKYGDTYAGIYRGQDGEFNYKGVYTLGGPFGDTPLYIDQTNGIITFLNSQLGNNEQNSICDTHGIPDEFEYRQEGNTTYVTTNGKCIELPENRNICDTHPEIDGNHEPVATGINLLIQGDTTEFEISGIDIPGIGSMLQLATNQSYCIVHAPNAALNHTVHTDTCLDITKTINSQFGGLSIPGINPPVTTRFKGTSTFTQVDDCFNTGADSIFNLVTQEFWFNNNGSYVKSN